MRYFILFVTIIIFSCGNSELKPGATDSLIAKEGIDTTRLHFTKFDSIDERVERINNGILNGEYKRKDFDGRSTVGTLYGYYYNDTLVNLYTEEGGESRSEQIIFFFEKDKLVYVQMKNNKFGKDATGQISWQIREVESERHIYFDGEKIIRDTITLSGGRWFAKNYDFIDILLRGKKELKAKGVSGPH